MLGVVRFGPLWSCSGSGLIEDGGVIGGRDGLGWVWVMPRRGGASGWGGCDPPLSRLHHPRLRLQAQAASRFKSLLQQAPDLFLWGQWRPLIRPRSVVGPSQDPAGRLPSFLPTGDGVACS